jgi:hypothetical protein
MELPYVNSGKLKNIHEEKPKKTDYHNSTYTWELQDQTQ